MKFYINKIILWLKNGQIRELSFENNKINVITGNSDTGKSTILEIIDYCLCGSKSGIADEHIGENVLWYGLNICINEKSFTIARGEKKGIHFSKAYYFSGSGIIPDLPNESINEAGLKTIIEQEFGITDKVVFPFGGKMIKQNTKISFRYFWMFNTQSGDVITHSQTYFDKQHEERYREALPRIFELATGITTIENLIIAEKIDRLEKDIVRLEKLQKTEYIETEKKDAKLIELIKKAKENRLIPPKYNGFDEDYNNLQTIVKDNALKIVEFPEDTLLDDLLKERQTVNLQIRNLKSFSGRYKKYKQQLSEDGESLMPITYLQQYADNINNEEYKQFLNSLEKEYHKIKEAIKTKMPFEFDVSDRLDKLEKFLTDVEEKITSFPKIDLSPVSEKERYIAFGEIKSELNKIVNAPIVNNIIAEQINQKNKDLDKIRSQYIPIEESRMNTIEALNDYIYQYMQESKDVFGTYSDYMPAFNYKEKKLNLRKSKSSECAGHTSSSVDLFRHLCLFLGLHEMIMQKEISYVAPFLILDQPTRPYFNTQVPYDYHQSKTKTLVKDDWTKVKRIFTLLNKFIENILENGKEMQVIVLEHVSTDAWENCNYVNLVEEFDGVYNALIKQDLEQ